MKLKNGGRYAHNISGLLISVLITWLVFYFTPIRIVWCGFIGLTTTTLIGILKEIYDTKKAKPTGFNKYDLFDTFWGALIGSVIITVILLNL